MPSARRRVHHPPFLRRTVTLPTPAASRRLGRQIAKQLRPGDVVLLHGTLGSGKTTFTAGVAAGLGIRAALSSPTFVLRKRYATSRARPIRALNHVDAYRLRSAADVRGILDEFVLERPHDVWIVEWGARFQRLFAGKRTWQILFTITSQQERRVTVVPPRRR